MSDLLSASLFADGGGAALVSARKPHHAPFIELGSFYSALIPEGEKDMAWTIGDTGFNMVLSPHIADLIGDHFTQILSKIFPQDSPITEIGYWAMHPGGRAILDKIERRLKLDELQMAASRQVLLEYGNMSSATIFFVLRHILESHNSNAESTTIAAMAFGPGLTVEAGMMTINL
jgi:predicted naringenin-chalcone synthase